MTTKHLSLLDKIITTVESSESDIDMLNCLSYLLKLDSNDRTNDDIILSYYATLNLERFELSDLIKLEELTKEYLDKLKISNPNIIDEKIYKNLYAYNKKLSNHLLRGFHFMNSIDHYNNMKKPLLNSNTNKTCNCRKYCACLFIGLLSIILLTVVASGIFEIVRIFSQR